VKEYRFVTSVANKVPAKVGIAISRVSMKRFLMMRVLSRDGYLGDFGQDDATQSAR